MHSQKSENCPVLLWFWCRTTPALVMQCGCSACSCPWCSGGNTCTAVSFSCCSSPSLPHCSDPLPPAELGSQYPTCCSLKMFLATFVWGLEGNALKPNKEEVSAVDLSSLAATSFPWCLQSGWLLARELVALHISAITPVHCHKHHREFFKTTPKTWYRCLSLCNCIWKRSQQPVTALGSFSNGIWTRSFSWIHFCTGIVGNSGKEVLFSWTWYQAHIPGRALFFPHQEGWHLHELMRETEESEWKFR